MQGVQKEACPITKAILTGHGICGRGALRTVAL